MHNYHFKLPYEFEAFQLGFELSIINYASEESFTKTESDEEQAFLYDVEFDDEDKMYEFDKSIRSSMPFLFDGSKM